MLGKPDAGDAVDDTALDQAGFSKEGDRELAEHILAFSRLLFENCANRRLYSSSQHLDALLNTTSTSLLNATLGFALRLAQKYAYDRVRQSGGGRDGLFLSSLSHSTLAQHYQINLGKLQKLSLPFRNGLGSPAKRAADIKETEQGLHVTPTYAGDFLSLLEDQESAEQRIESYGQPYFSLRVDPKEESPGSSVLVNGDDPSTTSEEEHGPNGADVAQKTARFELIEVPTSELLQKPLHEIVAAYMPRFPKQCQFEFLCRLRISKALCEPASAREPIIRSRLLGVANYLNIFPENQHQLHPKIFQTEDDEVRRTKLSSHLGDLLHPPPGKSDLVPKSLQTISLTVLEGYANHQKKSAEAIIALGANVNHGVLTYTVRKAVKSLSEDDGTLDTEDKEWFKALFSLIHSFPRAAPRAAEGLLATRVLDSFVEALRLRTPRATSVFTQILTCIDVFIFNIREAFRDVVNAGGSDALSDLFQCEVGEAFSSAMTGSGVPDEWRSGVIDYRMGFSQQAILRNIFKLLKNMLNASGGALDRNLRNLIESSQLLIGLRCVIDFPSIFGSNIWCGAVEIFSNFIHNEPTSYAALAEAGLTNAFLGTVTSSTDTKVLPDGLQGYSTQVAQNMNSQCPPATLEAISSVPLAFSAICLNENGMRQFVESHALETFFGDLLKPAYTKALSDAIDDHRTRRVDVESLGAAFDELARHHPSLKPDIVGNFANVIEAVRKDVASLRASTDTSSTPANGLDAQSTFNLTPLSGPVANGTKDADIDMEDADDQPSADPNTTPDTQAVLNRMRVILEILSGFLANTSFCTLLAEQGCVEKLLDLLSAPIYPLETPFKHSQSGLARVMSIFVAQKPHLVVPLLLERLQKASELCQPFSSSNGTERFLDQATKNSESALNAMSILRNILSILTPLLGEPSTRHSQNPMTSINVADSVVALVPQLTSISRSCILESALIQDQSPANLVDSKAKDGGALDLAQYLERRVSHTGPESSMETDNLPEDASRPALPNENTPAKGDDAVTQKDKQTSNKTEALLKHLPYEISSFLHSLGRCVALGRRLPSDSFQRAKSLSISTGIATALVDLISQPLPTSLSPKMTDYVSRHLCTATIVALVDKRSDAASQFLTIVAWHFKKAGGIDALVHMAKSFFFDSKLPGHEESDAKVHEATWAFQGLRTIFGFFMRATNQRSVHDAYQTGALQARADRERDRADHFSEAQFLVEMRYHALRLAKPMWESDNIASLSRDLVKHICTILQHSLETTGETGAFKSADKIRERTPSPAKKWRLRNDEVLKSVIDKGYNEDLAREALYRCMGHSSAAQEYCAMRERNSRIPRLSIPPADLAPPSSDPPEPSENPNSAEDEASRQDAQEFVSRLLEGSGDPSTFDAELAERNDALRPSDSTASGAAAPGASSSVEATNPPGRLAEETSVITLETLEDERKDVRESLVDRCLLVLSSFDNLTFELGDLITASVAKDSNAKDTKADIAGALLHSLLSYQDGDLKEVSGKIASSAHLLGVIFQDKTFLDNARDDLTGNVESLTQYLTPPEGNEQSQSLAWMSNILLILERMLSEDLQPIALSESEKMTPDGPVIKLKDPLISKAGRRNILNAVSNLLPKVGKDTSLATACLRVLIALTKDPDIALQLSEKRHMQRLFVMVKQLATVKDAKVMPLLLVILRHIVEDLAIIRQTMKSEIETYFLKTGRQSPNVNNYTRQLFHLCLRAPKIFVDVSNEMLALSRVSNATAGHDQTLVLKRDLPPMEQEDTAKPAGQTEDAKTLPSMMNEAVEVPDAQPSTEQSPPQEETSSAESKVPSLSKVDGVTTFILSELLAYKDVQDRGNAPNAAQETAKTDSQGDVEMSNGVAPTPAVDSSGPNETSSSSASLDSNSEFKLDDHPIFVYRCILMHCLTELLQSYKMTKLNFLAFSRKADPMATGTIKPRSGVINYLLTNIIAESSNPDSNIGSKKRVATGNWATNVLVALCARTPEKFIAVQPNSSEMDDDQDLAFVRRFVLEHALKIYKDTFSSAELAKEVRCARLYSFAELFDRMLSGKPSSTPPRPEQHHQHRPVEVQKSMAKIMFEKHTIALLTNSVSDIDQHTPDAQKALKSILKTLKTLTHTTTHLSQIGNLSVPTDQEEDDAISSAESLPSDAANGREDTPDLFRNSTLGMFDPAHEEGSSSGDSEDEDAEDEMYGEDYADDMEFDDADPEQADDEVVSDEDEDAPEDMGEVEGLPGDVPMEVEIDIEEEQDDDETDDESDDDDPSELSADDEDAEAELMEEIEGDESADEHGAEEGDEWQDEDEDEGPPDLHEHPHLPAGLEPQAGSSADSVDEDELELPGTGPDTIIDDQRVLEPFEERYDADDIHEDPEDQDSEDEDREMEEEEEEDDYDDDDMGFGRHGIDDDDDMELPNMPWQWPLGGPRRHHHHHHPRYNHHTGHLHSFLPDMDSMFMPELRSHRNGGPRTPDDTQGINPLLNRTRREQDHAPPTVGPQRRAALPVPPFNPASLFASLGRSMPDDAFGLDRQALDQIIQTLGQGGAFSISMAGTDSHGHQVQGLRHIFEGGPFRPGPLPIERLDPYQSVAFEQATTKQRWEEVARILFGPDYVSKSSNANNSLLKVLIPPASEREKRLKAKHDEEQRKFNEEQAKLAAEREEREAREKKEREEREAREAAEREAAEAEAARLAAESQPQQEEGHEPKGDATVEGASGATEAMEGVETTAPEPGPVEAGPSQPGEPVTTSIRGREVNISHLGIDTEYLNALPEEMREEVIMQQAAEHRSTQPRPQEGDEPTTIDSDFLAALPPDIREEILQQEAADRRRREREDARRQARESGAPAQPEEIDPASLLATLDPMLRQQVLAESDEALLAALPPDIQAEARALGGHRRRGAVPPTILGHAGGLPIGGRFAHGRELPTGRDEAEKRQRNPIVQMLDKAGVASLLRLMFVPMHQTLRDTLSAVLVNVCGNRQSRSEVVNGLLLILQDGSADVSAVERCFSQLTFKAKQQPLPKTPQKKTSPAPQMHSDISPNVVMEQSIMAINTLFSQRRNTFFVTEHDIVSATKGKSNRKGKAKDTKASRYPFMILVGLLGREVVMNNATTLALLAPLLSQVTRPLSEVGVKGNETKGDEKPASVQTDHQSQPGSEQEEQQQPTEAMNEASSASATTTRTGSNQQDTDTGNETASATSPAGETGNEAQRTAVETAEGESSKPKDDQKPTKTTRALQAPEVPPELLKPVVNMIMSRECNSKVFQNALQSMTYLAVIEGARDVFKHELIAQARSLAQTIQARLSSLAEPLRKAENEIDAQSLATAELSPTGSDQTQFHRILTALDYLYQPSSKSDSTGNKSDEGKDELIGLYEESSFMNIWNRLNDVLDAIKRPESTFFLNVATILLSLIESLMLVCKRIPMNSETLTKKQTGDLSAPKDMPSVFFSFTDQHRKILNELVRQNPKLMSNNFSVLIKNSGVLEFDNKRNYFSRRLHHRTGDMRHYPHPSLQLQIRREYVFLDSYKHLYYKSPEEIKYGKFNIRFHNEEGVDAGGVTREWFQVLARQMFNADYALFNPVASDRTTFHPNSLSSINQEHLQFFKFIGRIIGKALYENRVLDCHFSRAVYKKILGQPVSIRDMESVDLDYSKNMEWMLSNDIADIITETFSVTVDKFGVEEIVDLIPNGRNIPVTEENKEEYVRKVIEYRLTGSVSEQLEYFLKGFYDIVPTDLISIFDEGELELLISGTPDVDIDDWRANTDYQNYNASSPQIQWFWRAVRSFTKEERARLLQFVTGTGKVPLNGFKELEGMNGFTRFSIHKDYGPRERLPSSHTCFNQLDLPEYDNYEQLRKGMYTAMTTGNEHFGFA